MSFEITTAFVEQYKNNVIMLAQQKGSRLRGMVQEEDITGKLAYVERIGLVGARRVTTRHADSPLNPTPHSRRRISLFDYDTGDLIDQLDKIKLLIDPVSPYAMAHAMAMGRGIDDEIIPAFFDNAYSGEDGSTVVPFPTANVVAADSHKFAGGATYEGLTVSKLIEVQELMDSKDIDPDEMRFIAISPRQRADLLQTTEVTSSDYASVKALVEGKVDTFMGFKFIMTNRLEKDENSKRRLPVWVPSGMRLGIGKDIDARIMERADKRFSTYVYFCMSIGATRVEEEKVFEIKCTES